MHNLLPKCRLPLVLLFIVVQLQLRQVMCLQTTSLRTCSLDAVSPQLAEEVLQVSCFTAITILYVQATASNCGHATMRYGGHLEGVASGTPHPDACPERAWPSETCPHLLLDEASAFAKHMFGMCLLQIDSWNTFNVFQVGTMSRGSPLETVTLALFARHDLLDKLKIPYDRLRLFVRVSQLSVETILCHDIAFTVRLHSSPTRVALPLPWLCLGCPCYPFDIVG